MFGEISKIENVGSLAVPLHSPRRYLYLGARRLFSLLPPPVKIRIRAHTGRPYTRDKIDGGIRDRLVKIIIDNPGLARYFNPENLSSLLRGKIDKAQFDILATLLLYFDSRLGGSPPEK
mgnify:CR=1 FL=1